MLACKVNNQKFKQTKRLQAFYSSVFLAVKLGFRNMKKKREGEKV